MNSAPAGQRHQLSYRPIWLAGGSGLMLLVAQVALHFEVHGAAALMRFGDLLVGALYHRAATRADRDLRSLGLEPVPIAVDLWAARVFMLLTVIGGVLALGFDRYPAGAMAFSALGKALLVFLAVRLRSRLCARLLAPRQTGAIALNPATTVAMSFALAITAGWLLLSIPEASSTFEPIRPLDALFTATSATCVTGLIVKDTAADFSLPGKLVILGLIQIGGLGIMTLASVFGIARGQRVSLRQRMIVRDTLVLHDRHDIPRTLGAIALFTFTLESAGAILLYLRWVLDGTAPLQAAWLAVFHSVSAFCNAGFSLFPDSLERYSADLPISLVVGALIVVGGLGFPVALDAWQYLVQRRRGRRARLSLHTKLALSTSGYLLLLGFVGFLLLEWTNTLLDRGPLECVYATAFQSVTPRTAGFNTVSTAALTDATKFLLIMLMFVGASPGSTGGGIKTCTLAVLACIARAMISGGEQVHAFRRAIQEEARHRAVAIVILFGVSVLLWTFALCISEGGRFIEIMFESVSAFATVGLSTGVTPHLTTFGRLAIIAAMFMGRVGPLTIALAMAGRKRGVELIYPHEPVMVG